MPTDQIQPAESRKRAAAIARERVSELTGRLAELINNGGRLAEINTPLGHLEVWRDAARALEEEL